MQISGLSPLQRQLADLLWSQESGSDVQAFIDSLPIGLRRDAVVVKELIVAATIDEICDMDLDMQMAKQVIDMVK